MRVRWTGPLLRCGDRLREPGAVYDDVPEEFIAKGWAVADEEQPVVVMATLTSDAPADAPEGSDL